MISRLPPVGHIDDLVKKVNEVIEEVNKIQNHFHAHGEMTGNTSYPMYGKVSELKPGDGS